jgi:hypothetical protein
MIKLTSLENEPVFIKISEIDGIVQHPQYTHVVTKRWDYNVLETAEQIYEQMLMIDGTELAQAKNWFEINAKK